MTLKTVTIGSGSPREVYVDVDGIDAYANDGAGAGPDAWRAMIDAADDDGRARLAVQASRFFNALPWKGTKTTPAVGGTTLVWPRAGLKDREGDNLDDQTTPQQILDGICEAAMLFAVDNAATAAQADQASNIHSLQAGSASITYFRSTSVDDGTADVLPPILDRLVGLWLSGTGIGDESGSVIGGRWSGARSGSYMDRCRQYLHDREEF
jgi:hypothetical protein